MVWLLKVKSSFLFGFSSKTRKEKKRKNISGCNGPFFSWTACISLKHTVITISVLPSAFALFSLSRLRRAYIRSISAENVPGINIPRQRQPPPFPKLFQSAICMANAARWKNVGRGKEMGKKKWNIIYNNNGICFHEPCVPKAILWLRSVSCSCRLRHWNVARHTGPRPL